MTYIDLNMVRAGVVRRPEDWDVSGYSEIQWPWKRKRIIDAGELRHLFGESSDQSLADRLRLAAEADLESTKREPFWSDAVGVGDEAFLLSLRQKLGAKGLHRKLQDSDSCLSLRESVIAYLIDTSPKTSN